MNCVGMFGEELDVPIIGIAPVAFYDPLLSAVRLLPKAPPPATRTDTYDITELWHSNTTRTCPHDGIEFGSCHDFRGADYQPLEFRGAQVLWQVGRTRTYARGARYMTWYIMSLL